VVRLVAVVSCLVESTCTAVSMLQFNCPKSCLDELRVTCVDGPIHLLVLLRVYRRQVLFVKKSEQTKKMKHIRIVLATFNLVEGDVDVCSDPSVWSTDGGRAVVWKKSTSPPTYQNRFFYPLNFLKRDKSPLKQF
jgi:hypothetical protein